jgi:hypothetical protein
MGSWLWWAALEHAGVVAPHRAKELAVPDENGGHRAPWPHTAVDGPRETLPQRTRGASSTGWPEPASLRAGSRDDRPLQFTLLDYVRLEEPQLAGETDVPPPPEVLDRVLNGLRKLS